MANYKVPALDEFEWQPPVKDKDLSSPPGGESKGDRYIVGDSATGDWSGETDNIAIYNGSSWDFITATEGMQTWVEDENKYYKFDGSDWSLLSNFDSPVFTGESTIPTIDLTGGQIKFPATQNASSDANTLDDYEEGYHTATITCATNGTVTVDSSFDQLAYTKIGRKVTVQGFIKISAISSPSGHLQFSLPFTSAALTEQSDRAVGSVLLSDVDFTGAYVVAYVTTGTAYFRIVEIADNGALDYLEGADLAGDGDEVIAISLTYFTT